MRGTDPNCTAFNVSPSSKFNMLSLEPWGMSYSFSFSCPPFFFVFYFFKKNFYHPLQSSPNWPIPPHFDETGKPHQIKEPRTILKCGSPGHLLGAMGSCGQQKTVQKRKIAKSFICFLIFLMYTLDISVTQTQWQSCDAEIPLPHSWPDMSLPSCYSTHTHSPNSTAIAALGVRLRENVCLVHPKVRPQGTSTRVRV